ncbi:MULTISPECIES: 6-phosphofructokinase [unclassified Actinobaculum]|uniref:6-phosphofructokinase n=1 Tax=unclassified Actinobaculum TaxID=2609299 RepID=UPI000D52859D|nr:MULTISPECIES: 6-phosphofructokinase [unclassified Actinobaculum]AWE42121.1 6-phosphofructokinase [Actinobaculum sp. 313]RTE50680.1 6-phosphofructokinase [Actinobaculum sp. 352]
MSSNADSRQRIAVLTSGGDAPGMNAVVRAVVRTTIHAGAVPYAIYEGWKGAVEGGDLIRETGWSDVSNILNQGGTRIGTARSEAFRTREGMRAAVRNLAALGIDRVVAIGGDGTLTGAAELRSLWPELLAELVERGEITPEVAAAHPRLHLVGVVGSIDNDLVGSDMTVGTDSALHRIVDAIDAISSTAASHQRTFIIEVMGRRCGYLALMSAIAGGCDYVFIPELPPAPGWEEQLCEKLRTGRAAGRRDSIIVVAEGAQDRAGLPITATQVRDVLADGLGEEARITALGHVQRGGTPSAYDRWMPTLLGYTAALEAVRADDEAEPCIIATNRNRITRRPLHQAVADTRAVKGYLKDGDYDAAVDSRGVGYRQMIDIFETISSPVPTRHGAGSGARVAIMHAGGLAPGMNTAARAAVRLGVDRGFTMLGVNGGFPGLIDGDVHELTWGDVDSWVGAGGAALGTRRTGPAVEQYYALGRAIEEHRIDAILMIGGFAGYESIWRLLRERDRFPAFNIPFVCVPASIDNNLPGSELSIGADTALNNNTEVLDRIKQSASASRRCFVAETMGRKCGFLALMSGISSGAEQVYLYERGITLAQLSADTQRMVESFKAGRELYLVVRCEQASEYYTTDLLTRVFQEEGHGLFDVRPAILGHMQQGGNPSPFDRTLAVRLTTYAIDELERQLHTGRHRGAHVGMADGTVQTYPLSHMDEQIDMATRLPYDPWWLNLYSVLYTVADKNYTEPLQPLDIFEG